MGATSARESGISPGMTTEDNVESRPNIFDIDLDAIAHNFRTLRSSLSGERESVPRSRPNAYGFGLLPMAHTLQRAAPTCSAWWTSAMRCVFARTRSACPILLYGGSILDERSMGLIKEHDLIAQLAMTVLCLQPDPARDRAN